MYGELEEKLISLFESGAPDFRKAEQLILEGAEVNATDEYNDDVVLSDILLGYYMSNEREEDDDTIDYNPNCGKTIVEIIKFFLKNGFDVNKDSGAHGAKCLAALAYSTYDRYVALKTTDLIEE